MLVSDVYQDVYDVTAFPDEARNFSRINDAVECLSNKGSFDALLGYLVTTPVADIITLPIDVQVPLRINISDHPAFPRDKFFEFTMNGPGSNAALVNWEWIDKGGTPLQKPLPATDQVKISSSNTGDVGKLVTIEGRTSAGDYVREVITLLASGTTASVNTYADITVVAKPVTLGVITLARVTTPFTAFSFYQPYETAPVYRKIRISKTAAAAYVLFRRKNFRVVAQTDYIPIRSKMGLIYMVKSLEAYRNDAPDLGASLEALALKLATEEQNSNNPFIEISKSLDMPAVRGLTYGNRDLLTVSDIWDDAASIFGSIGYEKLLDRITETAQTLANKSNWDVMLSFLRVITEDDIITLPAMVEVPVKVTIDGNPAFSRNRFYEFMMNGPGTDAELVGWSWVDKGAVPVAFQPPENPLGTQLQFSGDAADIAKVMTITGDTAEVGVVTEKVSLGAGFTTYSYFRVISVVKPVTVGNVTLQTSDNTNILSIYAPTETVPQYRQIRVSKALSNVYIQYRQKSPVFSTIDDVIAVRSRMAIVLMMRAVAAYRKDPPDFQSGQAMEQQAILLANEEQNSFNAFVEMSAKSEDAPIRDLNYNSRDSIIFADVYDDFSNIFGPIGFTKLADKATESIEALANKGQWDPLVGYVDINTDQYRYVTLPRYVETILALKQCCLTGEFRNKWFEFNRGSWSCCLPCGDWMDAGEVCTTRDVPYSMKLYAIPDSPADEGKQMKVYGYYRGKRLMEQINNVNQDGITVTIRAVPLVTDALFDRIERITKPMTAAFVTLRGQDSVGLQDISIGFYYPDETEPKYRRIKLSKGCTRIRIMYRKRSIKIQALTDPIHLGSKLALVNMARALKTQATDMQSAIAFEAKAEQYLDEEQTSNNPLDMPELEWNDNSWHRQMI